ncbi:unnamed protein product [Strongylus vulgaris]|uniref:Uncharacterized protein n=1 Tax=Strongylus vulgaris TaxID=40348 RepID=A0A3P7JHW7_STRVU|nr:unnamed protein product [Strongylus vulgaris]
MSDSEGRTSDWTSSTTDYGEGPSSLGTRLGEGSEGTVVIDSTGSGETEIGVSDGSTGGKSPLGSHTWDRNRWNMSTIRGPNAQVSNCTISY